ncbi:MAG: transcription termination/antitermination protein NusG [bacterium]
MHSYNNMIDNLKDYETDKELHNDDDGADKKWYAVHTYSGFEDQVKIGLEERISSSGLKKYFGEIIIPKEDVIEKGTKGVKKRVQRKFLPGYIFINMAINTETWHLLKGTPKVTGFVGDQLNPQCVDESEIEKIKAQINEGIKRPKSKIEFSKGDSVKIIDGPFSGFNGVIDDIKLDKNKLEVLVSIFGRATPVELDFTQVERN